MTRAALYARYSTDKQREASIEDQARVCRARAEREGWSIVAQHGDDGISGSTPVAARPGGAALLADALAGRFEVLLVEGLDRLSREVGEQEAIVKRLEHRGIRLIGVSDGYDSQHVARKTHRIVRGLVNELYLDDLRAKVHRGLDGLVARSLFAGGLPYGYRSVPVHDGHRLEIDADRARWVRFIFERYAAGASLPDIAGDLNRRRVPSPRGSTWRVTALYGNRRKTCGIINNPLYRGDYLWNRSQWVKDPDTGKRKRIERPEAEWRRVRLPELAIVSEDLWQAVKARQRALKEHGGPGRGPSRRYLLSGIARCGICGGPMNIVSRYLYGCATKKNSGKGSGQCAGVYAPRRALEGTVIDVVREDLLGEEAVAFLKATVRDVLREQKRAAQGEGEAARARIAAVDREIHNLVEAIAACGISESLRARLALAEAERARLRAPAKVSSPDTIFGLIDEYRAEIDRLEDGGEDARQTLRDLVGEAHVKQEADGLYVELDGVYAGLLAKLGAGVVAECGSGGAILLPATTIPIIRRKVA